MFTRKYSLLMAISTSLFAAALFSSCSDSSSSDANLSCEINDDCQEGMVCISKECRVVCDSINDCLQTEICTDEGYCTEGAGECSDDAECTNFDNCAEVAICQGGECVSSGVVDGTECTENTDCCSAHCQNGFCCASGDCCRTISQCPSSYSELFCENTAACQGKQKSVSCTDNICVSGEATDDDTGCGSDILAQECYLSDIYCTDEETQSIPKCEGENGALCGLGSDCESGHCQNGFCCESGDCCSTSTDCPSSYNGDATCTDEVTCQGERFAATCNNNICAEATNASDDDSACTQQMLSDACGDAIEIYCTGEVVQNAPVCVTSLTVEHSANAKEFLVSFVPGANNGGVDGCQLQLSVDDTTWIPIAAPLFNCEQAANDIAVSLPADSWTTDWAGGVSLRMVRTDTDDVRGIASSRLSCALIDQSATATPTIDEDCNGEWDNVNVVMFPITVTESDRTYIPDMPYEVAASIDHEGSQINFASIVFLTDPLDTFLDSECTVPNAINVSTQSKVLLVAAGTVPSLNNEEYSIFSGACHPNGTINDVDVWSIFSAPWVTTVTTYANPTNWYL